MSLLEIVSQPDLRGRDEAEAFMEAMRGLLRYLEVSDCKMQEGSLRFELNISIRPEGSQKLGTKVEIKNIGSMRSVLRALDYEFKRQSEILEDGGQVIQETRLWDDERGETRPMRVKEGAKDYRYFPEPDIPPIHIDREYLRELRATLPELREDKRKRFVEQYQIPEYDAGVLTAEKSIADYFEACCRLHEAPKAYSNWIMTYILRELKGEEDKDIRDIPVPPEHLAQLVQMVDQGVINQNIAKRVINDMIQTGHAPQQIVKEKKLEVVDDTAAIEAIVDEVLAENPDPVASFRAGREQALNFLLGQAMRKSRGKASPDSVRDRLLNKLRGE